MLGLFSTLGNQPSLLHQSRVTATSGSPQCPYPSLLLIFSLHGGKDGEKEQDLSSKKATLSVAADNLQSYISRANIGTIFPSAPAPPASEFSHLTHPPA